MRRSCPFCRHVLGPGRDVVDASGDVGLAHRRCFAAWDARQEALEMLELAVPSCELAEEQRLPPRRAWTATRDHSRRAA